MRKTLAMLENVIIGKLIPAGTGIDLYSDISLSTDAPKQNVIDDLVDDYVAEKAQSDMVNDDIAEDDAVLSEDDSADISDSDGSDIIE